MAADVTSLKCFLIEQLCKELTYEELGINCLIQENTIGCEIFILESNCDTTEVCYATTNIPNYEIEPTVINCNTELIETPLTKSCNIINLIYS